RLLSMCFLNGGLFPETHHPVLLQKLLMSPIGFLIGRRFSRERMAGTFSRIFGPQTQPSEQELDAFWTLIITHNGPAVIHGLIRIYAVLRCRLMRCMSVGPLLRDRLVSVMQRTAVPLWVIAGAAYPICGEHLVERFHLLIANAAIVLSDGIGHYPQFEALEHV